jgi:hypothetical protein
LWLEKPLSDLFFPVEYLGDGQRGLNGPKLIPRFSWYISTYDVRGRAGIISNSFQSKCKTIDNIIMNMDPIFFCIFTTIAAAIGMEEERTMTMQWGD